jgi:hypothetical protein
VCAACTVCAAGQRVARACSLVADTLCA